MAVTIDCDHTDQFILCPQCDDGDPRLEENTEPAPVLVAKFHSECPKCGDDVFARRITRDPESGLWVCLDCV